MLTQHINEDESWAVEFYCGCWAFLFRSFFYLPCVRITNVNPLTETRTGAAELASNPPKSAASWSAIFAGAVVAASVSLILLALGTGLGFASISPWSDKGVSATTFTVTTAIWLLVMQWISALFGGYIAGRLRSRWIGTHVHEVFFRDTAHGLVTWGLSTLLVAAVAAGSVTSLIGGGVHAAAGIAEAGASSAGGAAGGALMQQDTGGSAYGVDKLFRAAGATSGSVPSAGSPGENRADPKAEAVHIVANAVTTGAVPDADRAYLVDQVEQRTGATPADAQTRVDTFVAGAMEAAAKAKVAADKARSAVSEAAIYAALSMLIGAFIASVAAAVGGRLRDEHP